MSDSTNYIDKKIYDAIPPAMWKRLQAIQEHGWGFARGKYFTPRNQEGLDFLKKRMEEANNSLDIKSPLYNIKPVSSKMVLLAVNGSPPMPDIDPSDPTKHYRLIDELLEIKTKIEAELTTDELDKRILTDNGAIVFTAEERKQLSALLRKEFELTSGAVLPENIETSLLDRLDSTFGGYVADNMYKPLLSDMLYYRIKEDLENEFGSEKGIDMLNDLKTGIYFYQIEPSDSLRINRIIENIATQLQPAIKRLAENHQKPDRQR